jgi:hypothetical protein
VRHLSLVHQREYRDYTFRYQYQVPGRVETKSLRFRFSRKLTLFVTKILRKYLTFYFEVAKD